MRTDEYDDPSPFRSVLKAHVALTVASVESSMEFYSRLFGIAPMKVRQGYAKFDVQNPPLNLSLNQGQPQGKGTLSHMGLQVATTADVQAIRNLWDSRGLAPRDEMQTNCCYALQDKAWVRDPDGNEWEVFAVLADVEQSNNSCCQGLPQSPSDLIQIGIDTRHG